MSSMSGMHDDCAEQLPSLRSQFWMLHASIGEGDSCTKGNLIRHEATVTTGPTNVELVGFANKYIPNSSCHYGGSLPLTAHSQENHVLIRSSNCWRSVGLVIPAQNPSFRQLHRALQSHYAKTAQSTIESEET